MMKKIAIVAAVVAIVTALAGGRYLIDRKLPAFGKNATIYVYPGMTSANLIDTLSTKAGINRPASLARCFASEKVSERLKPGKYSVDGKCSAMYAARMFSRAWQTPQNLTFSGTIRDVERLVKIISSQMLVDSATVADSLSSNAFLAQFGADTKSLFAYIIPDTYQMYWTDGIGKIMERMRSEYDSFWNEERCAKAAEQNLTPYQVSILASIVQGESVKESEYDKIAGVYLNRYKRGMKLEADPTVCYCYDYKLTRVLLKHLTVDSPYNTYKYAGLPPSPINVPSKPCLEAVLNPDNHGYLFFCASADFDGTHKFAKTLSEHNRNAAEFHRELSARAKKKK